MSLTVFYRGKNARFSVKLSKPLWLSLLVVFALISGMSYHAAMSPVAVPSNIDQADVINPTRSAGISKEELMTLTAKIAMLQSELLRLNALGDRLAEEANIPEDEFNFLEKPPEGGPNHEVDVESFDVSINDLVGKVNKLVQHLAHEEKQLKMLESLSLGHHIEKNSYLSGRPISKGWLSSYFGVRKDPFTGLPAMHKGIDFAGKEGASVIATGGGVVTYAGERYGYGNLIEIAHPSGVKTRYGHNKELLVTAGDVVKKGQAIAIMGSTGRSTGPHVHYEILQNDKQINPIKYVYRKPRQ